MRNWWNSITKEQCREGIYSSIGSLGALLLYLLIIYFVAPTP